MVCSVKEECPGVQESLSGFDWGRLLGQLGLGTVLGLAVGYATKKAIKVALVVIAIVLLISIALSKVGFITVNWDVIEQWWSSAVSDRGAADIASSWIRWFASSIAVSGSFVGGFIIGFKSG